jgi:hypothetical protein
VPQRLAQYRAGRRMDYAMTDPEQLAEVIAAEIYRPVDYLRWRRTARPAPRAARGAAVTRSARHRAEGRLLGSKGERRAIATAPSSRADGPQRADG